MQGHLCISDDGGRSVRAAQQAAAGVSTPRLPSLMARWHDHCALCLPEKNDAGVCVGWLALPFIQSALPGDVITTMPETVYDTATGRHLLIPEASHILGR